MDPKLRPNPNEELLYMLEFLIDSIDFNPEALKRIGKSLLRVCLNFIDFPTFEISQEEFSHNKKKSSAPIKSKENSKHVSVDFRMGKSCVFAKKPSDLVQTMRSEPLRIEIYKVIEKYGCLSEGDEPPICKTEISLPGCPYDRVSILANKDHHLPGPFMMKDTYNLIDNQGNVSGTITLSLRLSCLGKSILTQFALQEETFVFKTSQSPNEFQCITIPTESDLQPNQLFCKPDFNSETENPNLKPQNVIGLTSVCQDLAMRDGGPLKIFSPASTLESKIEIKELFKKDWEINFEREPEYICPGRESYLKNLTRIQSCKGTECSEGNCVEERSNKSLLKENHEASPRSPRYTGGCCTGGVHDCYKSLRMRGGGCCKGNETDSTSFENQTRRMMDESKFKDFSIEGQQSLGTLISGACKSVWKSTGTSDRTGCGCFGKRSGGFESKGKCLKKPCTGIDCLIRAFNETKEFVDSIGRVPGLAGLGLMDSSESPFFGRGKETENTCEPKNRNFSQNKSVLSSGSEMFPSQVRISQMKGRKFLVNKSATQTASNRSIHETVNFQNDVTNLAVMKSKKNEEKSKLIIGTQKPKRDSGPIDIVPYGDVKGKSRRKSTLGGARNSVIMAKTDESRKFSNNLVNNSTDRKHAKKPKMAGNILKKKILSPNTNTHQESASSNIFMKVRKSILKYVQTMGKFNPGVAFGHKNCLDLRMRVPKNMGWLWNTRETLGRKPPPLGWKPGAIPKYVYQLLQEAKTVSQAEFEERPSTPTKAKKGKATRLKNNRSVSKFYQGKEEANQKIDLPPTLHIHRKDGTYYITMYPIKKENINNPELQEEIKPLQFKVAKNEQEDTSACSSSTASDIEIEFSPPTAITHYCKKPEVNNREIQVKQQDILEVFKPLNLEKSEKSKGKKKKKK